MKTKRAALYLRVSTEEQSTATQRPELERMLSARGYELVCVFEETVCGAAKRRTEFDAMMHAARRKQFDAVFIWAMDRLGRTMHGISQSIVELDELGVDLISYQEPWLDTGSPVRSLLIAIFAWVAEFERRRMIERTNAGLARARADGVKLGRPRVHVPMAIALALRAQGLSYRDLAKKLGVPTATVHRAFARSKIGGPEKGGQPPRGKGAPPSVH